MYQSFLNQKENEISCALGNALIDMPRQLKHLTLFWGWGGGMHHYTGIREDDHGKSLGTEEVGNKLQL